MGRFSRFLITAVFTASLACGAGSAWAQTGRYADIIIDAKTGAVLHEENANTALHPASLTKMMTLYITFAALKSGKLDEKTMLPVSRWAAAASPTKLNLKPGQRISVEDCIRGLVTRSANDAARVLAENIGGSEPRFAAMMTAQAMRLGMKKTIFVNASGLPDPRQYSSARDMSVLARAILTSFPEYYNYFSLHEFTYHGATYPNHNHLMERYPGMDGIKTGYVAASGFNLVSSAYRNGHRLIGVVFGGTSAVARDNRMATLLDNGFDAVGNAAPVVAANTVRAMPAVAVQQNTADEGQIDTPVATTAAMDTPANGMAAVIQNAQQNGVQAEGDDNDDATPAAANNYVAVNATGGTPQAIEAVDSDPAPVAPKATSTARNWGIQIGAYKSKKLSVSALRDVKTKNSKLLQQATVQISPVKMRHGHLYRARMMGLDQQSAEAACGALKIQGRQCMTLPPRS